MKKGEIWLVDLYDSKGHEQKGIRPALVAGAGNKLVVVVPLTTNAAMAKLPLTHVLDPTQGNGLTEISVALVFQIVSLDESRFIKQLGWIPKPQRDAIDELLKDLLRMDAR